MLILGLEGLSRTEKKLVGKQLSHFAFSGPLCAHFSSQ